MTTFINFLLGLPVIRIIPDLYSCLTERVIIYKTPCYLIFTNLFSRATVALVLGNN